MPACPPANVVVHGGTDRSISRRWAEEVAGLLPHGLVLVVPDGSDAVPYMHPWLVARVVEQLVNARSRNPSG